MVHFAVSDIYHQSFSLALPFDFENWIRGEFDSSLAAAAVVVAVAAVAAVVVVVAVAAAAVASAVEVAFADAVVEAD